MFINKLPRPLVKYLHFRRFMKLDSMCRSASHIFVMNSVICGGAELEAINYMSAIRKANPKAKIKVVTTTNRISTWADKLKGVAEIVPFGDSFCHLPYVIQLKLLADLLIRNKPPVIHLNNSALGYELFVIYSDKIAKTSRIYVSVFCNIITAKKESTGWPVTHLPKFIRYVTKVFCDNRTYLDYLEKESGFNRNLLVCHYQPVNAFTRTEHKAKHNEILWAGRLDMQKRPDILIKIVKAASDTNLRFHIYGDQVLDKTKYLHDLTEMPNVVYHGPYSNFHEIPTQSYAMFLYTSEYDGIPNVVLEAMAHGLPVIASDVGGLHEIINDGKTGVLIKPFEDARKYLQKILELSKKPEIRSELAINALKVVKLNHSYPNFYKSLAKEKHYIAL